MRFNLKRPCKDCPFRKDVNLHLARGRLREITHAVIEDNKTFACHKTIQGRKREERELCAGAAIMVKKTGAANAMLQIAERFGLYNPERLVMDSPVYDTPEDMVKTGGER